MPRHRLQQKRFGPIASRFDAWTGQSSGATHALTRGSFRWFWRGGDNTAPSPSYPTRPIKIAVSAGCGCALWHVPLASSQSGATTWHGPQVLLANFLLYTFFVNSSILHIFFTRCPILALDESLWSSQCHLCFGIFLVLFGLHMWKSTKDSLKYS